MHEAGSIIAKRYRLDALLGEGGMGAVWRATHLELEREVAIKLVLKERASDHFLKRFMREARLAASVRHRNVIDVIDFGRDEEELPYLVMELLKGESLEQRLAREPAPTMEELLLFMDGALAGLAAIHDAGVVHRDLKPANLFLAEDAEGIVPKVLDFGISRAVDPAHQGSVLTHTMQTLGTPHYMSPEQIRSAREVDGRSDLYAMGVILYEALAGRRPFDGPSAPAIIASIVSDAPPALHTLRPDLPRALSRIVARAMDRDPERRFATATELREALSRVGQGEAPTVAATPQSKPQKSTKSTKSTKSPQASEREKPAQGEAPPRRDRRRFLFGISGGLMSLLGASAAIFLFLQQGDIQEETLGPDDENGSGQPRDPNGTVGNPLGVNRLQGEIAGDGQGTSGSVDPHLPLATLNRLGHGGGGPSEGRSLAGLALRWRELPEVERAREVRFVPLEEGEGGERWAAIARGSVAEATWEAGLRPALTRTRDRLNLRASPGRDGEVRTSLPPGALVVALYGRIGEGEEAPLSEAGGRGHWSYVVAGVGEEGFSASAFLEPERRCVPSARALIAALGPAFGGASSREVVIARAALRLRGEARESLLAVARGERQSQIRVASVDAGCALVPFAAYELPGYVEEAFFTSTLAPEEAGSEPLLVVSWRGAEEGRAPEVQRSWYVYPVPPAAPTSGPPGAAGGPAWEALLRSSVELPRGRRDMIEGPVTEGPGGARGFWPLSIQRAGEAPSWLRWTGESLRAAAAPEGLLAPAN